jgi:hypothetical protein
MEAWKSDTSIHGLQYDDVLGKSPAASVGAGSFDCTQLGNAQQSGYGLRTQPT